MPNGPVRIDHTERKEFKKRFKPLAVSVGTILAHAAAV